MTTAQTTPVTRVDAPNSLLRNDAGTIMQRNVPPPRPPTTLADPAARNSRSQSRSSPSATSRPARLITTQMSATSTSTRRLTSCPDRAAQSIEAKSAGPMAGHSRPSAVPVNRRPASLASGPDMPDMAMATW